MPTPQDNHPTLAKQVVEKTSSELSHSGPLLGFSHLVAPFSQTARSKLPSHSGTPPGRSFSGLLGGALATPKVAPPLHCIIRGVLQRRKVSAEAITTYLKQHKNLAGYDSAINKFWHHCSLQGYDPLLATQDNIASELLQFQKKNFNEARVAYSALLLIPGMEKLRFSPFLSQSKRLWNQSEAK